MAKINVNCNNKIQLRYLKIEIAIDIEIEKTFITLQANNTK